MKMVQFRWATQTALAQKLLQSYIQQCAGWLIHPLFIWSSTSPNTGIFFIQNELQQIISPVCLLLTWFLHFCLWLFANVRMKTWKAVGSHDPIPGLHMCQWGIQPCVWLRGWWLREEESCVQSINSKPCSWKKNVETLVYTHLWLLKSIQLLDTQIIALWMSYSFGVSRNM